MSDYKLVPVEPTAEMAYAGIEVYGLEDCADADVHAVWEAMLAASPTVQGEPVAWMYSYIGGTEVQTSRERWTGRGWESNWEETPLYTAPQPTEQQSAPDVAMQVMEALAAILRKAQGRTDTETGECIDVGAECMAIRREFDRSSKAARGVSGLVEALERSVAGFDALSGMASLDAGARNYARQKAIELNASLATHRKKGGK